MVEVCGKQAEFVVIGVAGVGGDGEVLGDSWMARRVGGILARLEGSEVRRWSACAKGVVRGRADAGAKWVEVVTGRNGESRDGEVWCGADGRLMFSFEDDGAGAFVLDATRVVGLWGGPRTFFLGSFERLAEGEARTKRLRFGLGRRGDLVVDRRALASRFFGGFDPPREARLKVGEEFVTVRLPAGYDARRPAGLLVWVSPSESGWPPTGFDAVADELGLILAGCDRSGNEREVADRLQLAIDAMALVMERWHVDGRRVYVAGMSGGGKVATMLLGCCPELFAGCVPIVGTGWWRAVPAGEGMVWPAVFGRPTKEARELVRSRRVAPVTGREDFNYDPVVKFSREMEADGVEVKVFDVPGLGHEMPGAEVLGEAVRWVDEPWRAVRAGEEARGRSLMAAHVEEFGEGPPRDEAGRASLVRMTAEAAWTEEAWRALEWLRGAGE
jgi:hypothetical protein